MAYFDIEQPRESNLQRNAGIGLVLCGVAMVVVFVALLGCGLGWWGS